MNSCGRLALLLSHDALDVLEAVEVEVDTLAALAVHLVHDVLLVPELEDVVVELHIRHHELGVLVDAADELLPVLGELVVLVDAVRELLLVLIELAVRVVVVHELLRVLLLLHDALDVLEAVEVEVDTLAALAVHLVHDVLLVPELEDVVVELHIRHHELGVLVDAADELLPVLGELAVLVDAVRELLLVFVKCLLNLLFGWLLSMNSCGRLALLLSHDALDVLEAVEVEVDTLAALAVHLVHDVLLVPELEDVVVELHIRHHELGVLVVDAADELLLVLGELAVLVDAVMRSVNFSWCSTCCSGGCCLFFCTMHSMFSKR